jgi:hypothetical protein
MRIQRQDCITIINKNYPPNHGITGESANELATYLVNKGIHVNVIHTNAVYGNAGLEKKPAGNLIQIKSIYNGKNKIVRLLASFAESYLLVKTALKKTSGTIITMTDPPFLIFWSAVLIKKRKWVYWSMDLFPEAFAAAKLTNRNSLLYKWVKRRVYKTPPHYLLSLGKLQLEYLRKDYSKPIPGTTLPCGIWNPAGIRNKVPAWKEDTSKLYFGYCGNLGEAHSFEFISEVIRQLDPKKHCFILSVYGSGAKMLEKFVEDYPVVKKVPAVLKNELSFIDIHLVTLKKEWNHICVPSKAVTAVCTGAAILFCGTADNDNWHYLQNAGWMIEDTEDLKNQVTGFLLSLTKESLAERKQTAYVISKYLNELKFKSFDEIAALVYEA